MNEEMVIDEIIADIASGAIDLNDWDALEAYIDTFGLDEASKNDILESINDVLFAEDTLVEGEPPTEEVKDAAQGMADEDNTSVEVEEEDSDGDGDPDKVSIKKSKPEDDSSDLGNSSEEDDEPHDEENSTNSIAKQLSEHKYW